MRNTKKLGASVGIVLASVLGLTALSGVAPAEAKTSMRVPAKLHALDDTSSTLKLDWKGVKHAKGYRVQFATSPAMDGAKYARFHKSHGTLRGLAPDTTYWFRVRVINPRTGKAKSPYTKPTYPSATTDAAPAPVQGATTVEPTSTPEPGPSTGSADVRVASFNISDVTNDSKAGGELHPWRERRPLIVKEILDQQADVVGLQEANMSTIYGSHFDYGDTQFNDLVGALNAAGGNWAVTNADPYNCAKAWSTQNCSYVYRGASNSSRIIYNADRLEPVITGSYKYDHQSVGHIARYLAWGVFRVKATGTELFFADTHLDSYDRTVRQQQWGELIDKVNELKNDRPVVVVGDFNTSKWDDWTQTYLPRMKQAGFGDVLDQHFRQPLSPGKRAQHLVNGWVNSFNGFTRDMTRWSYEDDHAKIGNNIDWIFASNNLTVKEWETVVDFDPSALSVNGILPSDHNMVRATITLS